jgi:hypothetical protein
MIRRISPPRVASFAATGAAALALVALVALPGGCSVKFGAAAPGGEGGGDGGLLNDWEAGSTEDVTPSGSVDASLGTADDAGSPSPYEGSPLCNASSSTGCYPDDPASAQTCNFGGDAGAGTTDDDAGTPYACHVSPTSNASVGPVQVCTAAGSGRDGDACTNGGDCAAGFECIGAGTCRHYCCDPTACDGAHSFCDIQTILDAPIPDTRVPVCMPVSPCTLLNDDDCPVNETCAVVKPSDGTTSCVPVGPQLVGQECETDHCAADLVCLGPLGTRKCYQLCETSGASVCPAGKTCGASAPEFQNPAVGICQ